MNHKNVPSFPVIKYRWRSPCCIDPPEEIHVSFDYQQSIKFLLALGVAVELQNWFWLIQYEKLCRNIKTKILIINLKSESLWID